MSRYPGSYYTFPYLVNIRQAQKFRKLLYKQMNSAPAQALIAPPMAALMWS
jgi:hypothetical protein